MKFLGFVTPISTGDSHTVSVAQNMREGSRRLYADGDMRYSENDTSLAYNGDEITALSLCGSTSTGTTNSLYGVLYSARIYDRILSDEEIKENAEADQARFGFEAK